MSHFCPRHGRSGDESAREIPGLRCDCTSSHAAGALRRGKWVRAAVPTTGLYLQQVAEDVEERANRAIDEALVAGYELGLSGGVEPARVKTCERCGQVYLGGSQPCLSCWAEGLVPFIAEVNK
jgi:hypothetical protein